LLETLYARFIYVLFWFLGLLIGARYMGVCRGAGGGI